MTSGFQLEGLNRAPIDELYTFEAHLGEGTSGIVTRVRDNATDESVVIKRLRAEIDKNTTGATRKQIEDRFWREVAILGQLRSPYSVRLYGAGFDVDTPYMVLELVDGRTLFRAVREDGAFTQERTRRIMGHVLHAMADAHSQGVIHRDLKPENIMIEGAGDTEEARVLDFGLGGIIRDFGEGGHVTLTRAGDALGTPSFMPREQIMELDARRPENDVYALGLLLLECLTGQTAVTGTMREVVKWQCSDEPVAIPEDIAESPFGPLIEKACKKDWQERYPNAGAMLEAFDAMGSPSVREAPQASLWSRFWSKLRRMFGGAPDLTDT